GSGASSVTTAIGLWATPKMTRRCSAGWLSTLKGGDARCPSSSRTSVSEWQPNARPKDILNQSGGIICIRAGHGDYKDKYFDKWCPQVANAKLVMIYLFMDTKDGDGKKNADWLIKWVGGKRMPRSEEHTSEPSHVKISYAVFCLKKKK